ncbi:MAG: hypothetical protein AB7S70_10650 [Hyphomicrobium sp.]|uniref:hypothetical protein n=1 Tax=Hyphomicrobium sp. TaxID=82 RepID=UPI003D104AB5
MQRLVRKILHVLLFAVALSASAANGYAAALAAFDAHSHGPHGTHSHAAHQDHASYERADQPLGGGDVGSFDSDQSGSASTDEPCTQMHGHCCSSLATAIPAGDCSLKVADRDRAAVPIAKSHVPPGQLGSPLFRPPRVLA